MSASKGGASRSAEAAASGPEAAASGREAAGSGPEALVLFLCGDVMTGRGLDQVLERSVDPGLGEPFVTDARRYVELAERAHGPIPAPVAPSYPWGDALDELDRLKPDLRIANLETAVTAGGTPWEGKGIHYRMHPANVAVLTAAGLDACVLANNHILDFGHEGLRDTLGTLESAGIAAAGAGRSAERAEAPAVLGATSHGDAPGAARVLLFAFGSTTSGIPEAWRASDDRPGVSLLPDLSDRTAGRIAERILGARREGDVVVVSVHWGGNWGYRVPREQRRFAHRLIDEGATDIVHGHSSHHAKGIEVYRDRPILYGCGDFLTDYEGIAGYERFRDDLVCMYFVALHPADGALRSLEVAPLRLRRFRLERPPEKDVEWLATTLDRESRKLGGGVALRGDGRLEVR